MAKIKSITIVNYSNSPRSTRVRAHLRKKGNKICKISEHKRKAKMLPRPIKQIYTPTKKILNEEDKKEIESTIAMAQLAGMEPQLNRAQKKYAKDNWLI